ncbi:hypothetical protein HGP17_11595 [Rhizobium sp. P38BS-XIX]|uniref:hypothetical protein n=1 Tax=Rhizobium sp. P38BS-XIX TaxID=2726740 RepID=UPI001457279F|nr:hypothetical protein [Rhizobium sp. P38BS-XIX]NLR97462.1 hypothetical protein [Rhizobium sp. P38BS-XIX]
MNAAENKRIARAIAEFGSAQYDTPSGALLSLMTEFLHEEKLRDFSKAVVAFRDLIPANAPFVIDKVPQKVVRFLHRQRGIAPNEFERWAIDNPEWSYNLKLAVLEPDTFQLVVANIEESIRGDRPLF